MTWHCSVSESAVMIRIQLYLLLHAVYDLTRFLRYVALRYHSFAFLNTNSSEGVPMQDQGAGGKRGQSRLLDRFTKQKPEFRPYKFDLAVDLHDRLEKLAAQTGMTRDAINDALNYSIRQLVTRLEREARLR